MLSFTLLGQVILSKNGEPLDRFRSQKEAALLIYLAHTGQIHQRDALAELLWEGSSTKQSLTNLRTVLSRLRKHVGKAFDTTRKTIGLRAENLQQVDSAVLWQTLSKTGQIDTAGQAITLQNALDAYHGDFLADFYLSDAPQFNEWVMLTREQTRRQVLSAYDKLGRYWLTAGDFQQGLLTAHRWLQVDDLDEQAHLLLIHCLLKTGDNRNALAHYEHCVKLFRTELGIQPAAEMTTLIQSISTQQPEPLLPARPAAPTPHNLPAVYDQFFGRKTVQQEIHVRFDQPWCRLITITGQGGVGKTRLSTTFARSRLSQYPDGVWLIELADIDPDDEDVAEAIAVEIAIMLDLRLTGSTPPVEQLLTHLQNKQMLLVLDNFEYLLEDGVSLVSKIITRCETVQLLVTSREPLNIRAEWTVALSGLSYPLSELDEMSSEAVELFVSRWAQQQYGEISAADLTAIRAICHKVEGLPLAIELAAALTRHATPQAILERLTNGFDALRTSLRDVPERHRSLHIVFEMSWRTLSAALQEQLTRLAVFRGGFTPTAAAHIAEATAEELALLGDKSLLTHHTAVDRYTLHPVIRAYAAAWRPTADPVLQKHGRYFLSLLADHAEPLQKARPQESIRILEPDIDNIRLAWQTGLADQAAELLYDALPSLSIYYQLKGLAHEGESVMRTTLNQTAAWGEGRASLAARAALERTRFQNRLGQARLAIQTAEKALKLAVQSKDRWAQAMARVWWGESLWRLGEYAAAEGKLTAALKQAQAIDSEDVAAWCHHQLGIINDIQSQYDTSLDHFQNAQIIWQKLDNTQNLSNSINSIGLVSYHQGNLLAAQQAMEQALKLCEQLENRYVQQALLNNLSMIASEQADYTGAQYYLQHSLKLAAISGNLTSQADIYTNLGRNYFLLGELSLASESLKQGLSIAQLIGNRPTIVIAMLILGDVRQEQHNLSGAETLYQQGLVIAQQDDLQKLECELLLSLAKLFSRTDIKRAKRNSGQAVAIAKEIQNPTLLERAHTIDKHMTIYTE